MSTQDTQSPQEQLNELLSSFPIGTQLVFPGRKGKAEGWETRMLQTEESGWDPIHCHPVTLPDGRRAYKFFVYTSIGSEWGNGYMLEEAGPTSIEANVLSQFPNNTGKMVGFIISNEVLTAITARMSISNAFFKKDITVIQVESNGEVFFNGQSIAFIHKLFSSNKNRLKSGDPLNEDHTEWSMVDGYIAYCTPVAPANGIVIEEVEEMVMQSMR